MDQIISAKERQAAEANKAANSLLKEIDLEKSREETRKVAAAKKREKRKAKKKGKQKTSTTESSKKTDEQPREEEEEVEEEEEEPSQQEIPPLTVATTTTTLVVDDDLRLKMIDADHEQTTKQSPPPEPIPPPLIPPPLPPPTISKQPINNKKKTNTMTRKIERHQENLASKNKQQEPSSTASGVAILPTDDGWQEVIGKQKKITIPHEQYSRIIGRSGSNLNVLREVTGASIEVENKRAIGDKTILIKYSCLSSI